MEYTVKVYYHDTDCGGVVYYATYLNFLENARTEFLARRGIDVKELIRQGRFFVVVHQEVDYRSPAAYGDTLTIMTRLAGSTGVRINLEHAVHKSDGTKVIDARTTLAFVDKTFRPQALPDALVTKLKGSTDA